MITDKINLALATYAKVCRLDPESWRGRDTIEELNEAYRLDDTGLTVFMLLQGLTKQYLDSTKFSAEIILKDPMGFGKRMAELKILKEILEDTEVTQLIADFEAKAIENGRKYGVAEEAIAKFPALLFGGEMRRDSLRSLDRLEAHQFLQGAAETDKLQLNQYVWEFWNINSLVVALRDLPVPSLTLALIRDPREALHSFFVFGIKNGENVTILTDRDNKPHPLYNSMSRRPDREMSNRAGKNWFPYRLIGLEPVYEEDIFGQKVVTGFTVEQRKGLVPYNAKGIRLTQVKDLEPEEMLWLMLTAERIDLRYGKEHHQLPQLSYTGEMVVRPYALAGPEGALVKSGTYQPILLDQLASVDVTQDSTAAQWDGERTNFNAWIEDRYKAQVPETILNLIGNSNLLALEDEVGLTKYDTWEKRQDPELTTFDPLVFGTEKQIRDDVVWHARHNQVVMMAKLATDEFEKTKDEIRAYWKKGIQARRQALIEAAALLHFPTIARAYACPKGAGPAGSGNGGIDFWGYIPVDSPVNLADKFRLQRSMGTKDTVWIDDKVIYKGRYTDWTTVCAVNGKSSTFHVEMNPDNPAALAALLGIQEEELPWQLRNWYTVEPYHGNPILRRLDPLEWAVKNPWRRMKFRVVVSFSRSGLNALRKTLGAERFTDYGYCSKCWNQPDRECKTCGRKAA